MKNENIKNQGFPAQFNHGKCIFKFYFAYFMEMQLYDSILSASIQMSYGELSLYYTIKWSPL